MKETKIDFWGWTLIISLFILLIVGGYLSYKSIDYQILTKLENQKLVLPTPIVQASPSATTSLPSTTPLPSK
jgi:hypothetical protein